MLGARLWPPAVAARLWLWPPAVVGNAEGSFTGRAVAAVVGNAEGEREDREEGDARCEGDREEGDARCVGERENVGWGGVGERENVGWPGWVRFTVEREREVGIPSDM